MTVPMTRKVPLHRVGEWIHLIVVSQSQISDTIDWILGPLLTTRHWLFLDDHECWRDPVGNCGQV